MTHSQYARLKRYKSTEPFSDRLNNKIVDLMEGFIQSGIIDGIDYTDSDRYDTFEAITDYYNEHHRLIVWRGASDGSVFGDPKINHLFRAWHDLMHILNKFDFSTEGESMTGFLQMAQLPEDWHFERQLILSEVIGQVLYYKYHNEFPTDQRAFALYHMFSGDVTIEF